MNPFANLSSPSPALAPAFAWFNLWMKWSETLWASAQVIGHRTELMRQAGATPSAADQKEMLLMGSEKVAAFSEASQRTMQGLASIGPGAAWDAGLRMMRSSAPALSLMGSTNWAQWFARQNTLWRTAMPSPRSAQRLSNRMVALSSRALAPVHATATANARRLNAKSPAKKRKPAA